MHEKHAAAEKLNVLIVDDEELARQRIVNLLKEDPDIGEIWQAENGISATAAIQEQQPDIVFLDIQMPGVDGFGVIHAIGQSEMPLTVFVTAYDQYAIKAFEADAVDYLLKAFSDERFAQTMARVKARHKDFTASAFGQNVADLAADRAEPGEIWDWLVVKAGGVTRFISASEIDWIEAANVYVNLHVAGQEYLYRIALRALAAKLDPSQFVRIHRSTIVNIQRIKELESLVQGEFEVVMSDGKRLHLSRTYRAALEKRLGQSL